MTDAGKAEKELFLILLFDQFAKDGKVHTYILRVAILQLGSWLVLSAKASMKDFRELWHMCGILDWNKTLIGFGCDGAIANMPTRNGLVGHLKDIVPWVSVLARNFSQPAKLEIYGPAH